MQDKSVVIDEYDACPAAGCYRLPYIRCVGFIVHCAPVAQKRNRRLCVIRGLILNSLYSVTIKSTLKICKKNTSYGHSHSFDNTKSQTETDHGKWKNSDVKMVANKTKSCFDRHNGWTAVSLWLPLCRKSAFGLADLDLWPLTLKTLSAIRTSTWRIFEPSFVEIAAV